MANEAEDTEDDSAGLIWAGFMFDESADPVSEKLIDATLDMEMQWEVLPVIGDDVFLWSEKCQKLIPFIVGRRAYFFTPEGSFVANVLGLDEDFDYDSLMDSLPSD